MNLIYLNLIKLFKKIDVKISLLIFALIPLLIAFLISVESNVITIGDSVFAGIEYATVVLGLLKSLFVPYIFMCLFSSSLIAGEIDEGVEAMYIAKIEKKERNILSKCISLISINFSNIIIIVISSSVGWLLFLKGSKYSTGNFFSSISDDNIIFVIYFILSILISLFFNQGKSLIISFLLIIISKLLINIDTIKQWIPTYLGDSVSVEMFNGRELIIHGFQNSFVLLIYICILLFFIVFKYNKMDFSR